ncbi:Isotrichodermin C-15 hydroxylase [Neonectria ditissima]|uniref:Isotrichodermin C-15 hydroxylase n=1 Tax=Neonectria ditissima TaxID=78410 RepID=A0A0P7BAA1_9HYPO|nr:Isotrichodermin C-15 hydroxylase [Neonectria ditissima]
MFSGQSHKKILELHQKYGPVVRVAPDELSFTDPTAWTDIMGHRKRGQGENAKDPIFWKTQKHSVISADRDNHRRQRRVLAHGFSAQSMMEQRELIQDYVSLLIRRLRDNCSNGERPLEMTSWFNWTTFDIIGDLVFGEPFGCLENSNYHPWVSLIFDRVRMNAINVVLRRFPFGTKFVKMIVTKKAIENFHAHFQLTQEKVAKRLEMQDPRPDFMESMTGRKDKLQMSHPEILDNASLLIIAGSETTATALSGAAYLLATNPEVFTKLANEVRTSFESEDDIDLLSVQKLGYMLAVLNETLRVFPPVPTASPRRVQPGGDTICGKYVPEDTILGIWQWPMYHNPKNFTLPESFIPERWLGDPRFANDSTSGLQPFSFGPRDCIGKNLAYAEMRLILAKIIWNFDMRIDPNSKDWLQRNEAYFLWQKPELFVFLSPRSME